MDTGLADDVGFGHFSEIPLCGARGRNALYYGHTGRPVETSKTGQNRSCRFMTGRDDLVPIQVSYVARVKVVGDFVADSRRTLVRRTQTQCEIVEPLHCVSGWRYKTYVCPITR